jgi:hypothetical protein
VQGDGEMGLARGLEYLAVGNDGHGEPI